MKEFIPSVETDKKIFDHVKWASKEISKIIKNKKTPDLYFETFGDAYTEIPKIKPKKADKCVGASRTQTTFSKYGMKSFISLYSLIENSSISGLEELTDYSGILVEMGFKDIVIYNALIQPRPLEDSESALNRKTGKRIRPHGWRLREWDGMIRFPYSPDDSKTYRSIRLFLQIAIYLIQIKRITSSKIILKDFQRYLASLRTNPKKVTKTIAIECLNHVIKRLSFYSFYNSTTFESYITRTLNSKIKDHHRKIRGIPKKYSYQRKLESKPDSERETRDQIKKLIKKGWTIREQKDQNGFYKLQRILTKKNVSDEASRKRLWRWLKKWSLDEIMLALF